MKETIRICEVYQKPESYFLKFLKAAVSSSSPLISRGYGSPFTKVNGFISRNEKSKSAKRINDHHIVDTGNSTCKLPAFEKLRVRYLGKQKILL
jgi:hypothetical protein